MNTDEVRAKFEAAEKTEVMFGGDIKYSNESNEYYCSRSYWVKDANYLNQRWQGYQQATKEGEALRVASQKVVDTFGSLSTVSDNETSLYELIEALKEAD